MAVSVTTAESCWLCPALSDVSVGVIVTVTGVNETVALALIVGLLTPVAVTVTVCNAGMSAGAVYKPAAVIDPTAGLRDQVTAVSAVNC